MADWDRSYFTLSVAGMDTRYVSIEVRRLSCAVRSCDWGSVMPNWQEFYILGIFIGALSVMAVAKLFWDRLSDMPRRRPRRRSKLR